MEPVGGFSNQLKPQFIELFGYFGSIDIHWLNPFEWSIPARRQPETVLYVTIRGVSSHVEKTQRRHFHVSMVRISIGYDWVIVEETTDRRTGHDLDFTTRQEKKWPTFAHFRTTAFKTVSRMFCLRSCIGFCPGRPKKQTQILAS